MLCTLLTYIFQFLNSNNETLVYYSVAQLLAKHTKLIYFIIARRITWKYHILLTLTYWHNFWLAFFSSFSIILYYLLLLCDVLTYITIRIYIWKCKCRHAGQACIKCCSIEFLWVCRYVVICVYMMMRCRGKKTWKY